MIVLYTMSSCPKNSALTVVIFFYIAMVTAVFFPVITTAVCYSHIRSVYYCQIWCRGGVCVVATI